MDYLVCLKATPQSELSEILGRVEANSDEEACALARTAFGDDPLAGRNDAILDAFPVEPIYCYKNDSYTALKQKPKAGLKSRNIGAISTRRRDRLVYLNAIEHLALYDRLIAIGSAMKPRPQENTNGGAVMGVGGGENYSRYVAFEWLDNPSEAEIKALDYLNKIGFDVITPVQPPKIPPPLPPIAPAPQSPPSSSESAECLQICGVRFNEAYEFTQVLPDGRVDYSTAPTHPDDDDEGVYVVFEDSRLVYVGSYSTGVQKRWVTLKNRDVYHFKKPLIIESISKGCKVKVWAQSAASIKNQINQSDNVWINAASIESWIISKKSPPWNKKK